ncbi:hypothetical protein TRFO_09177 [Tritrichomonas foetus]|uniref:MatE family protein n=1 Tax=Tritrichomonas foetus TaxID=1144522 RepID=A0A1J4JFK3_9EUKA|nr:hypothetical protein TRFO_09177 [Tritrichomonas foetus]|eukprot:OHS97998.1 hypothetical protein TRFO_09177 [Tritrichomonas foetus]
MTVIIDEASISSVVTDKSNLDFDNEAFTKHNPLVNLLLLSVGPFLTTFGMSILDSVDLIIISQRFKNDPNSNAVQMIGIGLFVLQLCVDVGMLLSQSLIVRVSALIGEGKKGEASQLFVDMCKITVLASIISAIIILFIARPLMMFAGCTEELIENCTLLVVVAIAGTPITSFFHVLTGFLQGIGKPVLNGFLHLLASCFQTFIFTPLLQFALKVDITMSNLSQVLSQSIIGIVLFVLIFRGKFSLKPNFDLWFNPFSHELKSSFLLSLPMIPSFIYALIPSTLIMRFMTSAASEMDSSVVNSVISVYTVFIKIQMFVQAIPISLANGLITAGTHAISTGNLRRLISTISWVLVITFGIVLIFCPLMIFKPLLLAKLFVSSEEELNLAKEIIPIPFYTFPIGLMNMIVPLTFVSVGKPFFSIIITTVQILALCISAKVLSLYYPTQPSKFIHSYNICDIITFVVTFIFSLIVFIPIYKKSKCEVGKHDDAKKEIIMQKLVTGDYCITS